MLYIDLRAARFEFVEIEQVLNDPVHPVCFICYYIAVKLPALRIIVHAVPKPFRVSLDQRYGCLEFMRYV